MKNFLKYSVFCILLFAQSSVFAGNPAKEIVGTWKVTKIETSEETLNAMIKDKFKDATIEFTDSGKVILSGNEINLKYRVEKNKIVFSEGLAKKVDKPEIIAEINKKTMTATVPAELCKLLILIAKEEYMKSGGDAFVGKLIENMALNSKIDCKIELLKK